MSALPGLQMPHSHAETLLSARTSCARLCVNQAFDLVIACVNMRREAMLAEANAWQDAIERELNELAQADGERWRDLMSAIALAVHLCDDPLAAGALPALEGPVLARMAHIGSTVPTTPVPSAPVARFVVHGDLDRDIAGAGSFE